MQYYLKYDDLSHRHLMLQKVRKNDYKSVRCAQSEYNVQDVNYICFSR